MSSLDLPTLVPSWAMPSWMLDAPASSSEAKRQARLRTLRQELHSARRSPVLVPLPPPPDDGPAGGPGGGDEGPVLGAGASNAVPFTASGGGNSGTAAPTCASRAEEARQVLPWLYAVEGRLDLAAMEALASQLALSGLQVGVGWVVE